MEAAQVEDVVQDRPAKKSRATNHVLIRSLVPNKIVGGLIGKGGANISTLRSACPDATIKVRETPDCPHAEERVFHVECEVNDIYAIFSVLIPQIFDGLTKNNYDNVKEPELCVLFSGVTMGSIIGKGGKTISALRTNTEVFMKAFPNKLQNCDERVLLLKGEVDKIINCLTQIYTTVEMDSGPYRQYNPSDGYSIPREPGTGGYQDSVDGFDSGLRNRGGGGAGARTPSTNSFDPPPFRKPGPDFYKSRPAGGFGFSQGAGGFDYSAAASPYAQGGGNVNYNKGGSEDSHGVGGLLARFIIKYPFTTYPGTDGDQATVKEVTLENSLTGCVIGDKGSRIRDVRASSGARIRIGDFDSGGQGERLITVEGTNIQCHLAEYMLQCCVQSFSGHHAPEPRNPPTRRKLQATPQVAADTSGYGAWAGAPAQPAPPPDHVTPGW